MDVSTPACETGNEYDGSLGLRISAIFIILVGSGLGMYLTLCSKECLGCCCAKADVPGALFPVFANRHKNIGVPDWVFFVTKFFGSGVIVATAFIHVSDHSFLHLLGGRVEHCLRGKIDAAVTKG